MKKLPAQRGWISQGVGLPVVAVVVLAAAQASAAELEPRAYVNTPPGINFLIAGYGYSEGGLSLPAASLIKALAEIPLVPGVRGHSIIAVQGDGDPKLGNDGVVEYTSAHLNGMASEFIVRSDHSSQLNPLAIDEVRRILVENLSDSSPGTVKQK